MNLSAGRNGDAHVQNGYTEINREQQKSTQHYEGTILQLKNQKTQTNRRNFGLSPSTS